MERKTYYQDDDIKVYLENINDQVFVHVAIYNANKSVFNKILQKWGEVVLKVYAAGYDNLFAYTKDSRIIKMIGGGEKIGEHEGFEVYKWELN